MRFKYRDWVLRIDPHNLIFVDESGINLGMTRLRGLAKSVERLYDSCPRNRGSNISLIGALSTEIINDLISSDDAVGWFEHCGLFM